MGHVVFLVVIKFVLKIVSLLSLSLSSIDKEWRRGDALVNVFLLPNASPLLWHAVRRRRGIGGGGGFTQEASNHSFFFLPLR
jgi:hypothetical protein